MPKQTASDLGSSDDVQDKASWEPPCWSTICQCAFCPTFRTFSRFVVVILICGFTWIIAYGLFGKTAIPGGQLFGLVSLAVAAHFAGFLVSLTALPRLIGMLFTGMLFQNVGWLDLDGPIVVVTTHIRQVALVIILTRAGFEIEPSALRKLYLTILKLGIVPWGVEGALNAVMAHYMLNLPWSWSCLLGAIIPAVSPAVVVPCLFRLRTKGYGVAKGIPTLVVAVAGVDDSLSVALFGILGSITYSQVGVGHLIAQAPVCILGGLGYGILIGCMSRIFPESGDIYVAPLRTLLLLTSNLMVMYASMFLKFEGAGPLAIVSASFMANMYWNKDGWDIQDNPVSTSFEIFWMILEPFLFSTTGARIIVRELNWNLVAQGAIITYCGAVLRVLVTMVIAYGDHLNCKERGFVAIAWMAKATVQAALGPLPLRYLQKQATTKEYDYAWTFQTICVLSVLLTAPLGAVLIAVTGPKLLSRTSEPPLRKGWRRMTRPSIRDMSIVADGQIAK